MYESLLKPGDPPYPEALPSIYLKSIVALFSCPVFLIFTYWDFYLEPSDFLNLPAALLIFTIGPLLPEQALYGLAIFLWFALLFFLPMLVKARRLRPVDAYGLLFIYSFGHSFLAMLITVFRYVEWAGV